MSVIIPAWPRIWAAECACALLQPALLVSVMLCGAGCEELVPWPTDLPHAGRVVALAVDPTDGNHILAASETGGLFITRDGGQHWKHADELRSFSISDVEFSPEDPTVVIATTKADFLPNNGGIWRSWDGGTHWLQVRLPILMTDPGISANCVSFAKGTDSVFVAATPGLLVGLVSTGAWSLDATVGGPAYSVLAQRLGRLWVAAGSGVWYSERGLPGLQRSTTTVQAMHDTPHAFATSPFDPSHVFFVGRDVGGWPELFSSTNGGADWDLEWPGVKNRPLVIRIAPEGGPGEFKVYFGHGEAMLKARYVGGSSGLTRLSDWRPTAANHSDPADIAFDPVDHRPLMYATDGGIHLPQPCVFFKLYGDKYLSAEGGGGREVTIYRPAPLGFESFVPTDLNGGDLEDGDRVQFKVLNGQYLTNNEGMLRADALRPGANGTFTIHKRGSSGRIVEGDEVQLESATGGFVGKDLANMARTEFPRSAEPTTFIITFDLVWRMYKGANDPLAALQITDVAGQVDARGGASIFFSTQDQEVMRSMDGGGHWSSTPAAEGYGIEVAPESDRISAGRVTAHISNGTGNVFTTDAFFGIANWGDPPGGSRGVPPFLIHDSTYAQTPADTPTGTNKVYIKQGISGTWSDLCTLSHAPMEMPVVLQQEHGAVVYQAVKLGWLPAPYHIDRIGIVRIDYDHDADTAVVSAPLGTGSIGCVGRFPTGPHWSVALGASVLDPNRLLVADLKDSVMKSSPDGGYHWYREPALTALITDEGRFDFSRKEFSLVSAIGFDPYNTCVILIGTTQNGIFKTVDGGNNWERIERSEQVPNISSFYFPPTGPVWVSTYGRGLWRVDLDRNEGPCTAPVHPEYDVVPPTVWIPREGFVPYAEASTTTRLRNAEVIAVSFGTITDFNMSGPLVKDLVISEGRVYRYDDQGLESGQVRNSYGVGTGNYLNSPLLQGMDKVNRPIKGLMVRGDTLLGVILSEEELPYRPLKQSGVKAIGSAGYGAAHVNDSLVQVIGTGFFPANGAEGVVIVSIDGSKSVITATVDASGQFEVMVPLDLPLGYHHIAVAQEHIGSAILEGCGLRVIPRDEDE